MAASFRRCGLHPSGTACGAGWRDETPVVPPPVRTAPDPDVCMARADGSCGRGDHPTTRSACNQETTP